MTNSEIKIPKKNAGKTLKEIYEKNRASKKISPELLEIIHRPGNTEQSEQKVKSAIKKSACDPEADV